MLEIHGEEDDGSEYSAAKKLAQMVATAYPTIENENNLLLHIFPSIKCHGQSPVDIDLLVLFADYRRQDDLNCIHSFCATVEVKGHPTSDVRFEGATCFVRYSGKEHNVTKQSDGQKYSVLNYIKKNSKSGRGPYVSNLIWLMGVPHNETPKQDSNILGMDVTWEDFCKKLTVTRTFHQINSLRSVCEAFSHKLQASNIDRKRFEKITKRQVDNNQIQYIEKLGEQLLIFRGRGGTGKTIQLLQIAYKAYNDMGLRVILLTYNKALVADLKRLLALQGIKNNLGGKGMTIKTIHSFMHKWMYEVGLIQKDQNNFLDKYEQYKDNFLEYLRSETISANDIQKAKTEASMDLIWDLILIDEAQDWPANERDLIYNLYEYKKVIIADGVDQFVRSVDSIDWKENIEPENRQIVPLRKSLRLKLSLCQAVEKFAEKIGYAEWNVQPSPEKHGGKVIVVTGDVLSQKFHRRLQATAKKDGNHPIDILFCVPPDWVKKNDDGSRSSRVAKKYKEWELQTWDATNPDDRDDYPTKLDQYRIVQYESCRGLEGWIVVNVALDDFFESKKSNAEISENEKNDIFFDSEESSLEYAKQWVMIPLTRAVDTLVLHVSNEDSYIGKVLMELHEEYPEIIELHQF